MSKDKYLSIFLPQMGAIRSHDMFRPMLHKWKYLMDYNLRYPPVLVGEYSVMWPLKANHTWEKMFHGLWKMVLCGIKPNLLILDCIDHIDLYIITKSMRTLWLVNQLWVIVIIKPRKIRPSSELLYKSNKPQVSVGYRLINHLGCW